VRDSAVGPASAAKAWSPSDDDVKAEMKLNMDSIMARGEKLEDLQLKTDSLLDESRTFYAASSAPRANILGGVVDAIGGFFSNLSSSLTSNAAAMPSSPSNAPAMSSSSDDEDEDGEKRMEEAERKVQDQTASKHKEEEQMKKYMEEEKAAESAAMAMRERIELRKRELADKPMKPDSPAFTQQTILPPTSPTASTSAFPASLRAPQAALSGPRNTQARPLDAFILLQSASGAFVESEAFFSASRLSAEKVAASLPEALRNAEGLTTPVKSAIWVSALALAFLEKNFSSEQSEWELIKGKIIKYINRALGSASSTCPLDSLLSAARNVL